MTRTLTTLTAAGALVAATIVTPTPARAMDPWTAAAWFVGGALVAGLLWAPYAYGRPLGYAAYGYAPGYSYGYAPGYSYGYSPGYSYGYAPGYSSGYGYAPRYSYASTVGMERRQTRRAIRRSWY